MNKIYFLDRNIVSIIKDSVNGKKQSTNDKEIMLNTLRAIDTENNIVSNFISIREGQTGKHESYAETAATIEKESEYIERFFKFAKKDTKIFKNNKYLISDIFSNNLEPRWDIYESFLKFSNDFILQPNSKKDKPRILKEIILYADKLNLPKSHPAFILVLSCLYGSKTSRSVIKPKKNKSYFYNEINDIMVLSRINRSKLELSKLNGKIEVEFLTLDKGLNDFLEYTKISNIREIKEEELLFDVSYNHSLFPELTEQEYFSLIKKIES